MTTTGISKFTLDSIDCETLTTDTINLSNLTSDTINATSIVSIPPESVLNIQSGGLLLDNSDLSSTLTLLKNDNITPNTGDVVGFADDSGVVVKITFDQSTGIFTCRQIDTSDFQSTGLTTTGGLFILNHALGSMNCTLSSYVDTLLISSPATPIGVASPTNLLSLAPDVSSGNISLSSGVLTVNSKGIYSISMSGAFATTVGIGTPDELTVLISVSNPVSTTGKMYRNEVPDIFSLSMPVSTVVYANALSVLSITAQHNDVANTYVYTGFITIVRLI